MNTVEQMLFHELSLKDIAGFSVLEIQSLARQNNLFHYVPPIILNNCPTFASQSKETEQHIARICVNTYDWIPRNVLLVRGNMKEVCMRVTI